MEQIEDVTQTVWSQLGTAFQTEIYNGKSLADLLTLEALIGLAGNLIAASLLIFLGFAISGFLRRKVRRLAEKHSSLDKTLFSFLGNILRYTILAFTALFVLNTFGVQTTSIVAVIGAAGLAVGLALQSAISSRSTG